MRGIFFREKRFLNETDFKSYQGPHFCGPFFYAFDDPPLSHKNVLTHHPSRRGKRVNRSGSLACPGPR